MGNRSDKTSIRLKTTSDKTSSSFSFLEASSTMYKIEKWGDMMEVVKDTIQSIPDLIIRLVNVPSITNTDGENQMGNEIFSILAEMTYFKANPGHLYRVPLENDPLSRFSVAGLLKGNGDSNKTIILLSHYDVVGVEDYGNLKDYAFDPVTLKKILRDQYIDTLTEEVKKDLLSEHWLFGRGIMDMKAGLAIQLAVLHELSQQKDFDGNILLLATPDEETNSKGMLASVPFLNRVKREHQLTYELCICSEPNFAAYPGDRSKYVYKGSVGKVLPIVMSVGKETHVGEPLEGMNAGWMLTEVVQQMEWSELFTETIKGESNPPPTCLQMRDLKKRYDVQTIGMAYAIYNILTLEQTPLTVLNKLKAVVESAAEQLHENALLQYNKFKQGERRHFYNVKQPVVYEFQELYQLGVQQFGIHFEETIQETIHVSQDKGYDDREITIAVAEVVCEFFVDRAPFFVMMLAPPYYPHVGLDRTKAVDQKIAKIVDKLIEQHNREREETILSKQFFTGLSDVSYCRIANIGQVLPTLEANMPLWGKTYSIPVEQIAALDVPTINVGPYGKDAHKRTERLDVQYSANVAPYVLKQAIQMTLSLNQ
ncbi:M20/M25/M40 family metallo-hydrolase [Gracilibacillus salinarum]|uniref:M20/M25/M40 family metallo-hydrolase n=1 Tax=Gracilibacillus salinarum TaxID=2932255 RepID=A0ABY4GM40_9BACI|nr:M20/M25/M40 family metallo-hydrolase [Gracilibacillus salinarum]UOQ84812.1 M20/M25/M40 family metallo-hydrolase [Gracilibacillus salinarum]